MLSVVELGEYRVAVGWSRPEPPGNAIGNVAHLPSNRRADPHRVSAVERELAELRAARDFIASHVADNQLLDPIFDRLEREIAIEEAKIAAHDPVARARAIVAARRQ